MKGNWTKHLPRDPDSAGNYGHAPGAAADADGASAADHRDMQMINRSPGLFLAAASIGFYAIVALDCVALVIGTLGVAFAALALTLVAAVLLCRAVVVLMAQDDGARRPAPKPAAAAPTPAPAPARAPRVAAPAA